MNLFILLMAFIDVAFMTSCVINPESNPKFIFLIFLVAFICKIPALIQMVS